LEYIRLATYYPTKKIKRGKCVAELAVLDYFAFSLGKHGESTLSVVKLKSSKNNFDIFNMVSICGQTSLKITGLLCPSEDGARLVIELDNATVHLGL
jgi:hypothetical protein